MNKPRSATQRKSRRVYTAIRILPEVRAMVEQIKAERGIVSASNAIEQMIVTHPWYTERSAERVAP